MVDEGAGAAERGAPPGESRRRAGSPPVVGEIALRSPADGQGQGRLLLDAW
jgi:hypothetical protein